MEALLDLSWIQVDFLPFTGADEDNFIDVDGDHKIFTSNLNNVTTNKE